MNGVCRTVNVLDKSLEFYKIKILFYLETNGNFNRQLIKMPDLST
jgi:hypothetical protein